MYRDLSYYHRVDLVDVIEGRGPAPLLVLALIEGLPDTSLTVALASGGREHYGWGTDRHLLADLFDALNQNTRASGNWGKGKVPKFPAWPRPKTKQNPEEKKPATVKDLFKRFSRR